MRKPAIMWLIMAASLFPGTAPAGPIAIAIHGGAGTISRQDMDADREQQYRDKLEEAVRAGYAVLRQGGSSVAAVQAAIKPLEDSPLFNAGKGAVFNADGQIEMDASIMEGATLNAGAVAAVHRVRNPIDLALKVMTNSPHVLLIGDGAEQFAAEQGIELVDPEYFKTEFRWQQLQEAKAHENAQAAGSGGFYSTVGAVALDADGHLAAGTSTGGLTNKHYGRVGDSPIIGAGTYANDQSCAVSGTGQGEYFMRWLVAYEICRRVADGSSVQHAADSMIKDVLVKVGGEGGVIVLDRQGNIAQVFNTEGMYRARIGVDGQVKVAIYGDE